MISAAGAAQHPTPSLCPVGKGWIAREGFLYLKSSFQVDLRALGTGPKRGSKGAWALARMREGSVQSLAQFQAMVSISEARRRTILKRQLIENWPRTVDLATRPDVQAFLEFGSRVLNEGDTFEYHFLSPRMFWMRFGDGEWRPFHGEDLTGAMLNVIYRPNATNQEALASLEKSLGDLLAKAP
jgi:hypothetical protein